MDGAWMTRGNGKCSTSKTGHATLMGVYGGEVMASDKRHLDCRACKTKGPEEHKCHKNWSGSSKAMESDIIANLILSFPAFIEENTQVTAVVGDEDSATMKKINDLVPWKVVKITDIVHGKKNFGGTFFSSRIRILTPAIIDYLKDCFSFALHQNKNKPKELSEALLNIPDHFFNKHDNCGHWCGFKKNPETYKHKRLPGVWTCSDQDKEALKNTLKCVCEKFAAKSQSLAPCLSSNRNECFNFLVTTLAPKARHYGGSFSIDRRIHAAVLQKNEGHQYVVKVNNALNLSPGEHTMRHRGSMQRARKRQAERAQDPEIKRMRRKDVKKSLAEQLQKERAEGVQYQSAMGFSDDISAQDEPEPVQGVIIPPKNKKPKKHPGTKLCDRVESGTELKVVVFDTETTGFAKTDEILQLAAKGPKGDLNLYCAPSTKISSQAAAIHKITFSRNKMKQNKIEVPYLTRREMIGGFLQFLEKQGGPVLLIGHNVKFDIRFLWREVLVTKKSSRFLKVVIGFCDSIAFFKSVLPNLSSYNQRGVCTSILGADFQYEAHTAQADVDALSLALDKAGFDINQAWKFSTRMKSHIKSLKTNIQAKILIESVKGRGGKLTDTLAKNIVLAGHSAEKLEELAKNKSNFFKAVSGCFKRQAAKKTEELYKLFVLC
jgi:DNA polymerase III epsilon subunit-like protein